MKDNRALLVLGGAAIVLVMCILGFFYAFERVDETVRKFPSDEAIRNPYLALERLAGAAGIATQSHYYLKNPDNAWVIFLSDPSTRPPPERVENWARWVEHTGGHLILSVPDKNRNETTAPVLARLGFRYVEPKKSEDSDASEESEVSDDPAELPASKTPDWPAQAEKKHYATKGDAVFPGFDSEDSGDGEPTKDEPKGDAPNKETSSSVKEPRRPGRIDGWASPDADWVAVDKNGYAMAASRVAGRGRITLVKYSNYFNNQQIKDGENASLSIDLISLNTPSQSEQIEDFTRSLSIVIYGQRESWVGYILGFIWPALVTLVIMLAFAIWRGRRRFGPMLARPPEQRRSRVEHIEAVGRFLWQHDSADTLVLAAQSALLRTLERRNPQLSSATGTRRWEIIARMLDVDIAQARQLFQNPKYERRTERFVAQIRALERYRRQL